MQTTFLCAVGRQTGRSDESALAASCSAFFAHFAPPFLFLPAACWTSGKDSRESGKLTPVLLLAGMGKKDDPKLMQEWFKLVQEKNALVRYESELMIL